MVKYVIATVLSLFLILVLYLFFKARYIYRNIDFEIKISGINITVEQLLDVIVTNELRFNPTFTLLVNNNSNFSAKLRNLRVIVKSETGGLLIYSQRIKKTKIQQYKTEDIELPGEAIIRSEAIEEVRSLIKGNPLKVNYKIMFKIALFPFFYEGEFVMQK